MTRPPAGHEAMAILLADARMPSGAYAHSGGVEEAVTDGTLADTADLADFMAGRLATTARLAGHVAARACAAAALSPEPREERWSLLDVELTARLVAPAVVTTSRRRGRALMRSAQAIVAGEPVRAFWHPGLVDPHLAIAQGVVSAGASLGPADAAMLAVYGSTAGAASAAVRLLGLDPIAVFAVLASLADQMDDVAGAAADAADRHPRDLPAAGAPISDLWAQRHAARKERLFAS